MPNHSSYALSKPCGRVFGEVFTDRLPARSG